MNLTLNLPCSIRVVNTENYKGNPRATLLVDDIEVLYLDRHVDYENAVSDSFRYAIARLLGAALLAQNPSFAEEGWAVETDRELSESVHDVNMTESR